LIHEGQSGIRVIAEGTVETGAREAFVYTSGSALDLQMSVLGIGNPVKDNGMDRLD